MENNKVESLVRVNDNGIADLSAQMIDLEAVQYAVSQLMDKIDEITCKGWENDPVMARLAILEFEKIVRLIDLGFFSLYTKMKKTLDSLENNSDELFDIVIKQNENVNHLAQ